MLASIAGPAFGFLVKLGKIKMFFHFGKAKPSSNMDCDNKRFEASNGHSHVSLLHIICLLVSGLFPLAASSALLMLGPIGLH